MPHILRQITSDTAVPITETTMDVLGRFGLDTRQLSVERFKSISNEVWRIAVSSEILVLRRYQTLNPQAVTRLHVIQDAARRGGVSIPKVRRTTNGDWFVLMDGSVYELTEHIDAEPHRRLRSKPNLLRESGRVLGLIHTIPPAYCAHRVPTTECRERAERVSALQQEFFLAESELRQACPPSLRSKLLALAKLVEFREPQQARATSDTDYLHGSPVGLIHGDYSRANVLFRRGDSAMYVIDWEYARVEPRVWELQRSLNFFCGSEARNVHLKRITDIRCAAMFLSGYRDSGQATEDLAAQLAICANYSATVGWLDFTLRRVLAFDFKPLFFVPVKIDKSYWREYLPSTESIYLSLLQQRHTAADRITIDARANFF